MRRPARRILEEANRPDAPVGAEIEPVMRAARHADEIAAPRPRARTRCRRRLTWNSPAALDDEADFVFVVPVLAVELREHASRFGVSGLTSMTSAVT